jgi:hypothetical protein
MADLHQMNELADLTPAITFRAEGNPPETYRILINAPGVARDESGDLTVRQIHRCVVYLHADYPRRPPVINWLTPIVHPNILPPDRNGGVCLGSWSASESLADVVRRLADLVSYRMFNTDDALDKDAAEWIRGEHFERGDDIQTIVHRGAPEEQVIVELARKGSQ